MFRKRNSLYSTFQTLILSHPRWESSQTSRSRPLLQRRQREHSQQQPAPLLLLTSVMHASFAQTTVSERKVICYRNEAHWCVPRGDYCIGVLVLGRIISAWKHVPSSCQQQLRGGYFLASPSSLCHLVEKILRAFLKPLAGVTSVPAQSW